MVGTSCHRYGKALATQNFGMAANRRAATPSTSGSHGPLRSYAISGPSGSSEGFAP